LGTMLWKLLTLPPKAIELKGVACGMVYLLTGWDICCPPIDCRYPFPKLCTKLWEGAYVAERLVVTGALRSRFGMPERKPLVPIDIMAGEFMPIVIMPGELMPLLMLRGIMAGEGMPMDMTAGERGAMLFIGIMAGEPIGIIPGLLMGIIAGEKAPMPIWSGAMFMNGSRIGMTPAGEVGAEKDEGWKTRLLEKMSSPPR